MWHVWGRREVHTGFWWGDWRDGHKLEGQDVDESIILKWTMPVTQVLKSMFISCHLRQGIPDWLFPLSFPTKTPFTVPLLPQADNF